MTRPFISENRLILPRSIVGWFALCWGLFLIAAVVVGAMLIALYKETSSQRIERGEAMLVRACDAILRETAISSGGTASEDVDRAVSRALEPYSGVEGGVWRAGRGSVAYAFPSYEGTGIKTDLPQAEMPTIEKIAESATLANRPVAWKRDTRSQVLLLQGCPSVGRPVLAAWSMMRVDIVGGRPFLLATTGLALLLAVLLGSAALLGRVLWRWSERLQTIERALATEAENLPVLQATGQRDLDRIVDAINGASATAAEARRRSDELRSRVAEAERLAALGRVAAGVAHEIRNPMAAIRLKAENALAEQADHTRARNALRVVVDQVARMERLLQNLLRSVHRSPIRREAVPDIGGLLTQHAALFAEQAGGRTIGVQASSALEPMASFDRCQIGRALDNLILNAIQNSADGTAIDLTVKADDGRLILAVADHGFGVPADIRDHLFEPFATGRADGTGLGLAIVREIAEAHGGRAAVTHRQDGTTFSIELPRGIPS